MSDLLRIDAHQHFWDIESGRYTWPTPEEGPIYRTFTPAELEPELRSAGIDATVLVQTVNTLADTDSMLANADRHGFIGAVIGWVPLDGCPGHGGRAGRPPASEAPRDPPPHPPRTRSGLASPSRGRR